MLMLAWFLVPEDYGLVAMMAVFLSFSNVIVEAGFKQALIRKLEVTQLEYSTAFFTNVVFGLFAYGVLFVCSPFIADFYEQPILVNLIRVASIAVILNSLSIVQQAVLNRNLDFKAQLKVSLPAAFLSGLCAIVLAYLGYGVWALVVQMLVSSLLIAWFYWRLKLWRPTFEFSWEAFRELFKFGGYLLVAQMINVPYVHMYVIVIAKYFLAPVVGLYFFAEKIKDLVINQLVHSIQTVSYPALARIQQDNAALKEGYRKIISVTTFLLFPFMTLLAAVANPLFHIILPNQWLPAVPYLQLMCIAALFYPLHSINLNILRVKGRSDLVLYLNIFKKFVGIIIFIISFQFGIIGILVGQVVTSVLSYFPNSYFSKKLIDYPVSEQMADFVPNLVLSMIVGGLVSLGIYWFNLSDLVELFLFGSLGVMLYLGGAYFSKSGALELIIRIVREANVKQVVASDVKPL